MNLFNQSYHIQIHVQGTRSTARPQFNGYGLYWGPIQLICKGKLSRPTFLALLISLNNLKRPQLFRYQLCERIIIRKTNISISILPQVCPRIISTYHIPFSVTKFLITFYISLSNFFSISFFGGVHFPYIATQIASLPSTWTTTNFHLDACPIKALVEVVEYVASCEGTILGLFCY